LPENSKLPLLKLSSEVLSWKKDDADDREKLQSVVDQWRRQRHDD